MMKRQKAALTWSCAMALHTTSSVYWTTSKTVPVVVAGLLLLFTVSSSMAARQVHGRVASVSITTTSGPGSLFETQADASPDPQSTVITTLRGMPEQEFQILTSRIVQQKGFTDLNGKHEFMGGLMILSELQARLVGKTVLLQYDKPIRQGKVDIYPVTELQVSSQ